MLMRWSGNILPGVEGLSGYLFACGCFLSLGPTFRQGGHIQVRLFIDRLSHRDALIWLKGCLTLVLVLTSLMVWGMAQLWLDSVRFNEVSSSYFAVPEAWVQAPMCLGLLLLWACVFESLFAKQGEHCV